MPSRSRLILALCLPLALAACGGEDWEWKLTNTHFPYGNQRTAGSGVIYVRAQMMREKDLNLKPAVEQPKPQKEKALKELRDMFIEKQKK